MDLSRLLSDDDLLDQVIAIQLDYILSIDDMEFREMEMEHLVDLLDIKYNS